jgi:uncharacterized SAM-binding protein YcdF (DUF218 family)
MFFLKKLITYFVLLPPGNVILFLILLGLFLKKKHPKVSKLTLTIAGLLYLLSIQPVANLLTKPLEESFKVPPLGERNKCQALVVLGGEIKLNTPFLDLKNSLREDSFIRTTAAYKLYEEKPRPIIVSGYSVGDQFPEAEVMKNYLTYLGVKPDDVIPEGKSRDTLENVKYSLKILRERNIYTFCLITSAYHMRRSYYIFSKLGKGKFEIIPVPVDFKASSYKWNVYVLLPTSYWLNVSSKVLKEYFGIVYEKFLLKRTDKPS